ncbi:uncharacterized protein LOC122074291 [Macadamia integrifolia]|uniref:uncharacterized protein LOC122074291 n=1 Tax=Macadamia integrifolia TaxID=60698 RepID=UPI001C4E3780|nr:uncharacterized protein LOC122074291 [Macadamia integrifolia]
METETEMEMEMELPECPVCLQVYNSDDTVPRVLPCGHSACEACLKQLPQRFSNTIRCPACTQLVKYPEFQGPSALPKNIDLLSFINSQSPKNTTPSQSSNQTQTHLNRSRADAPKRREFFPRLLWSEEFYSNWKDWILPIDSVSVVERGEELLHYCALQGKIESPSSSSSSSSASLSTSCWFPEENQLVSLVCVGYSSGPDSAFKLSYNARVMEALNRLKESERMELDLIVRASLRQRRVCKFSGLWMDSKDGSVFLVCEKFNGDFLKRLSWSMDGAISGNSDGLTSLEGLNLEANGKITAFAMVGTELCEALMGLHSEGLVSGCLAFSCFRFDDFGCISVDTNEILVMGRRVRRYISEASGKGDDLEIEALFANLSDIRSFVSPELLFELLNYERITAETESGNSGYSIGYGSDLWSLACILVRLLLGERSTEELFKGFSIIFPKVSEEKCAGYSSLYNGWMDKVGSVLDTCLGSKFSSLQQILCRCLNFDPAHRPHAAEIWRYIRELLIKPHSDTVASLDATFVQKKMTYCFILGDMCHLHKETVKELENQNRDGLLKSDGSSGADADKVGDEKVGRDLVSGLCLGSLNSINLQGHLDCVTKFAVGGGFLFSSSYDKTVNVWSLQWEMQISLSHCLLHKLFHDAYAELDVPNIVVTASNRSKAFDRSLSEYYSTFRGMVELNVFQPLTINIDKLKAQRNEFFVSKFLASLNNDLKAVKGHLLAGDTVPTLNNTYSRLQRITSSTKSDQSSKDNSVFLTNRGRGCGWGRGSAGQGSSGQPSDRAACQCTYCGKPNHTIETCWAKHGKSEWHLHTRKMIDRGREKDGLYYLNCGSPTSSAAATAVGDLRLYPIANGVAERKNRHLFEELSGDELQRDTRAVGSITCDSVITALLFWQGKLFVGCADGVIKVYYFNCD